MLECAELWRPLPVVRQCKQQVELVRQSAAAIVAVAEKEPE